MTDNILTKISHYHKNIDVFKRNISRIITLSNNKILLNCAIILLYLLNDKPNEEVIKTTFNNNANIKKLLKTNQQQHNMNYLLNSFNTININISDNTLTSNDNAENISEEKDNEDHTEELCLEETALITKLKKELKYYKSLQLDETTKSKIKQYKTYLKNNKKAYKDLKKKLDDLQKLTSCAKSQTSNNSALYKKLDLVYKEKEKNNKKAKKLKKQLMRVKYLLYNQKTTNKDKQGEIDKLTLKKNELEEELKKINNSKKLNVEYTQLSPTNDDSPDPDSVALKSKTTNLLTELEDVQNELALLKSTKLTEQQIKEYSINKTDLEGSIEKYKELIKSIIQTKDKLDLDNDLLKKLLKDKDIEISGLKEYYEQRITRLKEYIQKFRKKLDELKEQRNTEHTNFTKPYEKLLSESDKLNDSKNQVDNKIRLLEQVLQEKEFEFEKNIKSLETANKQLQEQLSAINTKDDSYYSSEINRLRNIITSLQYKDDPQRIKKLEDQVSMLRNRELNLSNSSDNTRYQVEINRLQQELDRTKSDDFSNVHRISQLENELNYLRQQETNTLSNPDNREIDRLLNELNYYRSRASTTPNSADYNSEVERLRNELNNLRNSRNSGFYKPAQYYNRYTGLEDEIKELRQRINNENNKNKQLEGNRTKLEERLRSLESQLRNTTEENTVLNNQIRNSTQQLQRLQAALDGSTNKRELEQIQRLNLEIQGLRVKLDANNKETLQINSEKTGLKDRLVKLVTQNRTLTQRQKQLEAEKMKTDRELEELKALQDIQDPSKYEEELKKLRSKKEELEKSVLNLQSTIKKLEEEYIKKNEDLKKQITQLLKEKEQQEADLEEFKSKEIERVLGKLTLKDIEEKKPAIIQSLKEKIEQQKTNIKALEDIVRSQSDRDKIEEDKRKLTEVIAKLRKHLEKHLPENKELTEEQDEQEYLRKLDLLDKDLQKSDLELEDINAQIHDLLNFVKELEEEEGNEDIIRDTKAQIQELEAIKKELSQGVQKDSPELRRIKELEEANSALIEQLQQIESSGVLNVSTELESERDRLSTELALSYETNIQREDEIQKLQDELSSKDGCIRRLEEEHQKLQAIVNETDMRFKIQEKQLEGLLDYRKILNLDIIHINNVLNLIDEKSIENEEILQTRKLIQEFIDEYNDKPDLDESKILEFKQNYIKLMEQLYKYLSTSTSDEITALQNKIKDLEHTLELSNNELVNTQEELQHLQNHVDKTRRPIDSDTEYESPDYSLDHTISSDDKIAKWTLILNEQTKQKKQLTLEEQDRNTINKLNDIKENIEDLVTRIKREQLIIQEREAERLSELEAEAQKKREQEVLREAETQKQREQEALIKEEAEAERQSELEAETQRVAAEAETQRVSEAETQRVSEAETQRVSEAEAQRVAAETETQRVAAEAETQRVAAEEEAQRVAAEEEAKRVAEAEAEAQRVAAEEEAKRVAEAEAEAQRVAEAEAEAQRVAEEAKRVAEEAQRVAAEEESKRLVEAETQRLTEEEAKRVAGEAKNREGYIRSIGVYLNDSQMLNELMPMLNIIPIEELNKINLEFGKLQLDRNRSCLFGDFFCDDISDETKQIVTTIKIPYLQRLIIQKPKDKYNPEKYKFSDIVIDAFHRNISQTRDLGLLEYINTILDNNNYIEHIKYVLWRIQTIRQQEVVDIKKWLKEYSSMKDNATFINILFSLINKGLSIITFEEITSFNITHSPIIINQFISWLRTIKDRHKELTKIDPKKVEEIFKQRHISTVWMDKTPVMRFVATNMSIKVEDLLQIYVKYLQIFPDRKPIILDEDYEYMGPWLNVFRGGALSLLSNLNQDFISVISNRYYKLNEKYKKDKPEITLKQLFNITDKKISLRKLYSRHYIVGDDIQLFIYFNMIDYILDYDISTETKQETIRQMEKLLQTNILMNIWKHLHSNIKYYKTYTELSNKGELDVNKTVHFINKRLKLHFPNISKKIVSEYYHTILLNILSMIKTNRTAFIKRKLDTLYNSEPKQYKKNLLQLVKQSKTENNKFDMLLYKQEFNEYNKKQQVKNIELDIDYKDTVCNSKDIKDIIKTIKNKSFSSIDDLTNYFVKFIKNKDKSLIKKVFHCIEQKKKKTNKIDKLVKSTQDLINFYKELYIFVNNLYSHFSINIIKNKKEIIHNIDSFYKSLKTDLPEDTDSNKSSINPLIETIVSRLNKIGHIHIYNSVEWDKINVELMKNNNFTDVQIMYIKSVIAWYIVIHFNKHIKSLIKKYKKVTINFKKQMKNFNLDCEQLFNASLEKNTDIFKELFLSTNDFSTIHKPTKKLEYLL